MGLAAELSEELSEESSLGVGMQPEMGPGRYVLALVDCPGAQAEGYTYRVPIGVTVRSGDILAVPFGGRSVGAIALGWTVDLPPDLDAAAVREIEAVVATGFFPATYWQLLERVAAYYCTALTQVVRTALPPGILARSQRRLRLNRSAIPQGAAAFLSPAAAELLAWWQGQGGTADYAWRFVVTKFPQGRRAIGELLKRAWLVSYLQPPKPTQAKQKQAVWLNPEPTADEAQLTPRQREILGLLRRRGGDLWLAELVQLAKTTTGTVRSLAAQGWLTIAPREVLRQTIGPAVLADRPQVLTPAQATALAAIAALGPGDQALLHGVTGSGKTEVYLQAIEPILARGQAALVLVPEIGLTPQLTDRFRARFGARVLVYHSRLSDGERYDTWRQLLDGAARVVIGTRSAVFAPLPNLGLIILDEEHDSSFKQDQPAPCYHARTVATWRSHLEACPLVLGSATPSLESWLMATTAAEPDQPRPAPIAPDLPSAQTSDRPAQALYLSLPDRIQARPLPPVDVIDMREELKAGNRSIFSRSLQAALGRLADRATNPTDATNTTSSEADEMSHSSHRDEGQGDRPPATERAILFIHRRGHSSFVACRSCGYVMDCPNCDVSLSYHHVQAESQPLLRCHFCNHSQVHPPRCPACSSPYLKHFGSGSQRVVRELASLFPQLRSLRYDSDTTRNKDAHRILLDRFIRGEADVLVGTQMLAKGLDLPAVTLVGIVAADGLLHRADYRAAERAVQTLIQVAGRAGRGDEPGRVILQTYTPEAEAIAAVRDYAYTDFLARERDRRADLNYPPIGRLILFRFSGLDPATVEASAHRVADDLAPIDPAAYDLLGPAPAEVTRVARRFRWQLLLRVPPGGRAPDDLAAVRSLCLPGVSLTIDVDPLSIL